MGNSTVLEKRELYKKEFSVFLEQIFLKDGVEGIANSLPFVVGSFVVTVDGKIVAANDAFMNLVGYKREEIYGHDATDITHPDDRFSVRTRIAENDQSQYNLRLLAKDTSVKHVTVSPVSCDILGTRYRLAEFVDNTELLAVKQEKVDSFARITQALSNAIEKRDPYTNGHMRRTAHIADRICDLLGCDTELQELIYVGASIHDIGKISLPIEILIKPGSLNEPESALVQKHPQIGFEIFGQISIPKTIKQIVLLHHEHPDGSGYPSGIRGSEIPLGAAIVCVADCLEAISGVRPYHEKRSFEEAIDIMKRDADKFCSDALEAASTLVASGEMSGDEFLGSRMENSNP